MLIKCHFLLSVKGWILHTIPLKSCNFFLNLNVTEANVSLFPCFQFFLQIVNFLLNFDLKSRNNLLISKLILRMQKFTKQVYNFFLECNDWLVLFTKIKKYNRYEMAGYFCWGLNLGPSAWQVIVLTITPWGCKKDSWNHSSK